MSKSLTHAHGGPQPVPLMDGVYMVDQLTLGDVLDCESWSLAQFDPWWTAGPFADSPAGAVARYDVACSFPPQLDSGALQRSLADTLVWSWLLTRRPGLDAARAIDTALWLEEDGAGAVPLLEAAWWGASPEVLAWPRLRLALGISSEGSPIDWPEAICTLVRDWHVCPTRVRDVPVRLALTLLQGGGRKLDQASVHKVVSARAGVSGRPGTSPPTT